MKEPTRLIHGEGSALERLFLNHAAQEEPSEAASALMLLPLFSPEAVEGPAQGGSPPTPLRTHPAAQGTAQPSLGGGAGAASMHPGAVLATVPGVAWLGAGVLVLGLTALGIGQLSQPREALPVRSTQGPAELGVLDQQRSLQRQSPSQGQPSSASKSVDVESPQPQAVQADADRAPVGKAQPSDSSTTQTLRSASRAPADLNTPSSARPNAAASELQTGELQADVALKAAAPSPVVNLRDEVALLEQVRAALRGGQVETALRRLARYDARFPQGALREEAVVLRMEALKASGQDAAASELRTQFLLDHPDSPHQARVKNTIPK